MAKDRAISISAPQGCAGRQACTVREQRNRFGQRMIRFKGFKPMAKRPEDTLQGDVIAMLRKIRVTPLVHRTDRRTGATRGWPDITFAYRGQPVLFELKAPDKKPTQAQNDMHKILRKPPNLWHVFVIQYFSEAVDAINSLS
jgi:hypothetical protein